MQGNAEKIAPKTRMWNPLSSPWSPPPNHATQLDASDSEMDPDLFIDTAEIMRTLMFTN